MCLEWLSNESVLAHLGTLKFKMLYLRLLQGSVSWDDLNVVFHEKCGLRKVTLLSGPQFTLM